MRATATIRLQARASRTDVRTLHHFLVPRSGSGSFLASKPGLFLASAEGLLARTKPDSFDTDSLIAFLKDLKRSVKGAHVILIWDHLPAHRSKAMKSVLFQQRDWLEIEWLPGYAPDLNPTEGVWNNIKGRELANFCADHILESTVAFRRGLKRIAHSANLPFAFLQHAGLFF
jgi:transposase